ncbi:MAG: HAD hydrolase-like protein [Verrucomicrobiota bacterium JB023]|nr:HAD hydrolase-like protein [Verrucomicrobiota bacterium JB023]
MFANLILDWSGTLVDDFHPTLHATNVIFDHHKKPRMDAEQFREHFRLPYPDFYEEFLPGYHLEELETMFKEAFLTAEEGVRPLEHTERFLTTAKRLGLRLFVLTSMNREAFDRQARAFGFTDYFEATYAGVLDKRGQIERMLSTHGLDARDTAYVGDMVHDIEAGQAGGVTTVAVLSGYDPPARLAGSRPDLILQSIGGIIPLLEQMGSRSVREDIVIRKLATETRIGVPEGERSKPQTVKISLVMETRNGILGLDDEFSETVDYFEVSEQVRAIAGRGERKLIETLAEDIAVEIKSEFHLRSIRVTVEKMILQNCEAVSVTAVK